MRTFKDNAGREWPVTINVRALQRARQTLGSDFGSFTSVGETFQKLHTDDVFLAELAWNLCGQDAEKTGVSEDDFLNSLSGDSMNAAYEAVSGELIDFFRDPSLRENLRRMAAAAKAGIEQATRAAAEQVETEMAKLTEAAAATNSGT